MRTRIALEAFYTLANGGGYTTLPRTHLSASERNSSAMNASPENGDSSAAATREEKPNLV